MFLVENGCLPIAGVTQLVECDLAKVDVAGSNPVSRSKNPRRAFRLVLANFMTSLGACCNTPMDKPGSLSYVREPQRNKVLGV